MRAGVQAKADVQAGMRPIPGKHLAWDMKQALLADAKAHMNAPGPDPAALAMLRQLLQAGTDPNAFDAHGAAALHAACRWRDLEAAQVLLGTGAYARWGLLECWPACLVAH